MSLNYKRVKTSSEKVKNEIRDYNKTNFIPFDSTSSVISRNIATHYFTRTLTLYYAKHDEN